MDIELITIEPQSVLAVFTTPHALDPYLQKVRDEIDAFKADASTAKGRAEIKSFAFKVTRVKTGLDRIGKDLADDQKKIPKKIDEARRLVRETLEAWADEVRLPLTEWEAAEAARVAKHKEGVKAIALLGAIADSGTAAEMREAIATIKAIEIGPQHQEFEPLYREAVEVALFQLESALPAREQHEADQAELAKLRKEAAEREAKDREEAKARELAARAEEEAKAKAAEADRIAKEAEERALRQREREEAEAHAAAQRREANKRHRNKVHRQAAQALVEALNIEGEIALDVIQAIADGKVPNVAISY